MKLNFRFWDKENHKMIYDYPYSIEKEKQLMINTKIKDDKKRYIYEGDIVRQTAIDCRFRSRYERTGVVIAPSPGNYFIKYYENGEANTWFLSDCDYDYDRNFEKEILGNIYENKDLYKKIKRKEESK